MESKFNYKNFSIVIPIYNEEEIIKESTNAIFAICNRTGLNFEFIFSENVEPNYFDIQIPPLEPGELFSLSDLEMTVYGFDFANSIIGNLNDSEGNNILKAVSYTHLTLPTKA